MWQSRVSREGESEQRPPGEADSIRASEKRGVFPTLTALRIVAQRGDGILTGGPRHAIMFYRRWVVRVEPGCQTELFAVGNRSRHWYCSQADIGTERSVEDPVPVRRLSLDEGCSRPVVAS